MTRLRFFGLLCLLLGCSSIGHAGLIDLNDFYSNSPNTTVSADGALATMTEDPFLTTVLLENNPLLGDPVVIIAAENIELALDYTFTLGAANFDEFGVFLLDGVSGGVLASEIFNSTSAGTISFDLGAFAPGQVLGLSLQLTAFDFLLDSTASVRNVRLVSEPASLGLVLAGLLGLRLRRRAGGV